MAAKERCHEEETFEIESFRSHRPKKMSTSGYLEYNVKWVGFKDTTWEGSWQLETLSKALEYWRATAEKDTSPYLSKIGQYHRLLHEWQKERFFLRSDDFFSISRVESWVRKYDWTWQLQQFYATNDYKQPTKNAELLDKYKHQINHVGLVYENSPRIEVVNECDYSLPIPWKQLLFGIEERGDQPVAAKETIDKFGLILSPNALMNEVKLHRQRLRQQGRPKISRDYENERVGISWAFRPSKTCLKLARTGEGIWELYHQHSKPLSKGQVIMPLTGELVDVSVANECMRADGKFVAMSCFVRITEDLCLDRRYRSGFDRYIQHSCNPNCVIELAWWNEKPVAMVVARRELWTEEPLTVDFFSGFNVPASAKPTEFFSIRRAHVFCTCGSANFCRGYIWMDGETESDPAVKNIQKKNQEDFYGLTPKIEPRSQQQMNAST